MYLHVSNVDERDLCPPLLRTAQWESVLVVIVVLVMQILLIFEEYQ